MSDAQQMPKAGGLHSGTPTVRQRLLGSRMAVTALSQVIPAADCIQCGAGALVSHFCSADGCSLRDHSQPGENTVWF